MYSSSLTLSASEVDLPLAFLDGFFAVADFGGLSVLEAPPRLVPEDEASLVDGLVLAVERELIATC